jgi:hypothetical protein
VTVYVLSRGSYDEFRVVGIYSTREKAESAGRAGVGREKYEQKEDFDIEEYELDEQG